MPTVELLSITPNATDLIKTACSMPYGKDISDKVLQGIIASGHTSVLEHAVASFHVKCSVRVLGQITRHRFLSFTVKSARARAFNAFVHPRGKTPLITNEGDYSYELDAYRGALDAGLPFEEAAYWLPQGVETEFVVTGNFREWLHYLGLRLCKRAMPEHQKLAREIFKILKREVPQVFDRKILKCGDCPERSCSFK